MSFRTWLGRELRSLLREEASPPTPLTPSPASAPISPTSTMRTSEQSSADPDTLERIFRMMMESQERMMAETRGLVMDILQGRERPPLTEQEQLEVSRTPFDPPDYDAEGTEDLPPGIAGIFEREDRETTEFRTQHSEPELLRNQLERARQAAGLDAQGPTREPSFSTESIGLWPDPAPPAT